MRHLNLARVILGGLVAGLIINISEAIGNLFVFADSVAADMKRLGLSGEFSTGQIVAFNVIGFAVGIFLIWLYAAIRPRFGAGPKTALAAALAVWIAWSVLPGTGNGLIGLFSAKIVTIGVVWGLVELILAALAGAALYKEEAAA